MDLYDPAVADVAVARVVGGVTVVIVAALGLWARFYRTRRTVSGENGERVRFESAIEDAGVARKEAHDAKNEVMAMQRQMGRLEAENEQCNKRADRQDLEIAILKAENKDQAGQIREMGRQLRKLMKLDDTASDFGGLQ